jgi:hypothetical protein
MLSLSPLLLRVLSYWTVHHVAVGILPYFELFIYYILVDVDKINQLCHITDKVVVSLHHCKLSHNFCLEPWLTKLAEFPQNFYCLQNILFGERTGPTALTKACIPLQGFWCHADLISSQNLIYWCPNANPQIDIFLDLLGPPYFIYLLCWPPKPYPQIVHVMGNPRVYGGYGLNVM